MVIQILDTLPMLNHMIIVRPAMILIILLLVSLPILVTVAVPVTVVAASVGQESCHNDNTMRVTRVFHTLSDPLALDRCVCYIYIYTYSYINIYIYIYIHTYIFTYSQTLDDLFFFLLYFFIFMG